MTRRGWLLFAAMSLIWGLPYLLIRVAVAEIDPATLVFVRVLVAAVVLLPIALARRMLGPVLRRWRPLLVYSIVEIAVPWLLLGYAEERLTSSLTGILVAVTPLVGAVIAVAMRGGEGIDGWRVAGLAVGFGGVIALLGLDLGQLSLGAVGEVGIVCVCYAVGPVILARTLGDLPGVGVVAASVTVTAVLYLPIVAFGRGVPRGVSASVVGSVLVLGVICTALAFVVFFALINDAGPARAVVITYLNPAVALALGVAVLGERTTVGMAVGFPLILVGCVLGARRRTVGRVPAGTDAGVAAVSGRPKV